MAEDEVFWEKIAVMQDGRRYELFLYELLHMTLLALNIKTGLCHRANATVDCDDEFLTIRATFEKTTTPFENKDNFQLAQTGEVTCIFNSDEKSAS